MKRNRFLRIFIIVTTTLGVLFITALTIGGGYNLITVQLPVVDKLAEQPTPLINTNLTNIAGKQIVAELITSVKNDAPGGEWNPNPDTIVKTALASVADSFDPEDIFPIVKSSSFIIDSDQSLKNQRAYFTKLLAILGTVNNIPVDTAIDAHTKAISALYALPVPKALIEIHREAIVAIGAQKNIFTFLKASENDPLQAVLVAQSEPLVTERIQALYDEIARL